MSAITNKSEEQMYQELVLQGITGSARKILDIIVENKMISGKDIIEKSGFSSRTSRTAIKILLNFELIQQIPNLNDCRSYYYKPLTFLWKLN